MARQPLSRNEDLFYSSWIFGLICFVLHIIRGLTPLVRYRRSLVGVVVLVPSIFGSLF